MALVGNPWPDRLSPEQKMQLCHLSYQVIHGDILYADNDDIDEEGFRDKLKQLSNFFKEMSFLIEDMTNAPVNKKERFNALLVDHMKCRSHLQAASTTFKKEGQTAKFFEDLNECGRLVGLLLTNHFASTREDH